LIFADDAAHREFFARLGQQWRAEIAPPSAQGYTVQDIATATYRPELGVRRPVYLHESVHAIVSRDLRLLVSHDPHTPIQEGIASYVQLCVYPQSLDPQTYVQNFRKPIDPSGQGFFKPLEMLFSLPATPRQYAQLASLVAYLLENDQPLLRELARGLADGQTAEEILLNHGTSWQQLQDAWLAWGRQKFPAAQHDHPPPFDLPAEFR